MTDSQATTRPPRRDRLALLLAATALFFAFAFAIVDLAGWRPYASVLSGSLPEGATDRNMAILLGLLYTISYFGVVVLTPICLLALPLYWVLTRGMLWKREQAEK